MKLLDYVTAYTSPNSSGDFRAESITIHWWGEPKNHRSGRIGGVVDWLCQARARASAHFVVSGVEKRFACIVGLNKASWHAANWTGNHRSVAIEMHPFDSSTPKAQVEADLEACAYVVALIWHWKPKTKDVALKGHRDWVATECPGDWYYHDLDDIFRRALKLYPRVDPKRPGILLDTITDSKPAPAPLPDPTPSKDGFDMASIDDLKQAILSVDDRVPVPNYHKGKDPDNPHWTIPNTLRVITDLAHQTRAHAIRAEQNSAAALEIAREQAKQPGPLTDAQIEAAAKRGLASIITDTEVTVTIAQEDQ